MREIVNEILSGENLRANLSTLRAHLKSKEDVMQSLQIVLFLLAEEEMPLMITLKEKTKEPS